MHSFFRGIEIPLHWCVSIWTPGSAHALHYLDGLTKLCKCLWCILRTLVTMQNQFLCNRWLWIQSFLQGTDCKITDDITICNAGHYASVTEVYDRAVVTNIAIFQEQVGEIHTPLLVGFSAVKSCFSLFSNTLCDFPTLAPGFLGQMMERSHNSVFIYLWIIVAL